MNKNIKSSSWSISEDSFSRSQVTSSESLFSLGNGVMGIRGNFEEKYSGNSLKGSYVGGVYYPDKTRVGWWKNGYPDYFAKVVNSAFWIGINVTIDGEEVDLAKVKVLDYCRELDLLSSVLIRKVRLQMSSGKKIEIRSLRFVSLANAELGVIKYTVKALNKNMVVGLSPYIDADVRNADSNYDEKFWDYISSNDDTVQMRTKKSAFDVAWSQKCVVDGMEWESGSDGCMISQSGKIRLMCDECLTLYKYVGICSSLNHTSKILMNKAADVASKAQKQGFSSLLREHTIAWRQKWNSCDITIEGDLKSQQGIRYCIFMLLQTYTGVDSRLNIGPKGFTGEKYGGVTYWDTEAYCLPFYMSTTGQSVARELLLYRYNQLDKAIENARKLGFSSGAALYPMVTINGEECHNEWEITFEEIHRNGAIAYAIYNYIRYTGDKEYLSGYGLEVLIAIARFWAQRVTFSNERDSYMILGVTGPNEYENNVNNNWYTNYIASWCLSYAEESVCYVKRNNPKDYKRIVGKTKFDDSLEVERWAYIRERMYLPYSEEHDIFMQQDGYMDKEQMLAVDLPKSERPINQKWSWDRILRSCFIKQADVLQGIYFFQDDFDENTISRNFYFYEPRTLHESSLSPSVHAVLAAKIGDLGKAYEMFTRSARLDLDDYNNEISEGLHITSMAGAWLAAVEGFGGMRVRDDLLHFTPTLPKEWESLQFKIKFRGRVVVLNITHVDVTVSVEGEPLDISICGTKYHVVTTLIHHK